MAFAYPDLDNDIVFKKLLKYGMFPYSIDTIFSSRKLGELVINDEENQAFISKEEFSLLPYKWTRNNNAPRYMGVPHPLAYISLCKVVKKYWDEIDKKIGENNEKYLETSMIVPKDLDGTARLILCNYGRLIPGPPDNSNPDDKAIIINKQLGAKYFVFADISGFFPNIYSHAIPWALVGKEEAKSRRSRNEWFNDIDINVRKMKNDETNGLPIGPDTSNIFSELILSQVDRILLEKYKYVRYTDDYHCYCSSKEEAENFIKDLSLELEKYQLALNTTKTKLVEMPQGVNSDWIGELRNFHVPDKITKREDSKKVLNLLDLGIKLSKKVGNYAPFKFAMKKAIRYKEYDNYSDFKKIFLYICSVVLIHPYMIDELAGPIHRALDKYKSDKSDFEKNLQHFLEKLLHEHVQYGRSDVILWSIFLAIKHQITINNFESISDEILEVKDPLPALIAFLYAKINKHPVGKYYNLLSKIDQEEWWLYIYELYNIDNEVPYMEHKDFYIPYIKYENFYQFIKSKNISFLSSEILNKI